MSQYCDSRKAGTFPIPLKVANELKQTFGSFDLLLSASFEVLVEVLNNV